MEVLEAIRSRRSIRRFKPDPVPERLLLEILDAGRWAPSGGNIQPWLFIVVKDSKTLKLVKMFSPGLFGDPPVVVAYIADLDGVEKLFKRLLRTSTSTPLFLAKVLASPLE